MKSLFKKIIVAILTFEAKVLIKRKRPKIIAITGSVGKTSTKDAVYAALKDHTYARKSQKSFNSDLGVPLSVLGIDNAWSNPLLWLKNIFDGALTAFFAREYPEVLVLEMGVDRPGDMKKLTQWIRPDVVVLTRLPDVPAHIEYFATPEEVIAEKMHLVHALRKDGVFIYNNDDEVVRNAAQEVLQQSFGYSRYSPSHFVLSEDGLLIEDGAVQGMRGILTHVEESVELQLHGALGIHQLYTFAAAAAVAKQFDVSLADTAQALGQYMPPAGRMRLLESREGALLIDDTYNASPTAVEQALLSLKEIPCKGRKIVVLGDMLELGRFSVGEHERIGVLAAEVADVLVTLGVRARKIAEAALENGLSEKKILQYENVDRAAEELLHRVTETDVVLIKASQGIRAERVTKKLMKHPKEAGKLLVRQSAAWQQR